MKNKERSWALTKEDPILEVKKDHEGPKSQKEEKRKEIIIKKKKRGSRSGQRICSKDLGQRICSKKSIKALGPRCVLLTP